MNNGKNITPEYNSVSSIIPKQIQKMSISDLMNYPNVNMTKEGNILKLQKKIDNCVINMEFINYTGNCVSASTVMYVNDNKSKN